MRNKPSETADWPSELSLTADGDGWNIFEVASSILNKEGDRPFQLQKIDDAGGIGRSPFDASSFETDQDAQLHVLKRAGQGYALHKLALEFLRRESPREYEEIIALRTCSADPRVQRSPIIPSSPTVAPPIGAMRACPPGVPAMPEHPRFRKILDRVAIRDEIHELLKAPPDCSTEDLASGRAYAGRWFELPQAEHDAMLDLMPPAYMQPGMFVMSEPKAGSIASVLFEIVVRGTRRCFHGYCDLSIHGSTESMRAAIVEQEHAPIGILTRDAKLEAIWERTHPDYRGIAGEANPDAWPREQRGKRTILVHQRGTGTVLKLLDDLTDEEIDAKLPLIVNIINPA